MRIWLDKTVDQEFLDLGNQGHKGTLNDRQYSYLDNAGYYGALGDKFAAVGGADITAPVLSGNSLNDTDDEFTFSTTEGGTLVWGISSTATPLTPDGAGGWTEATVDEGTDTVATSGQSTLSITTTASGAVYLNYYIRDAAGNDSNVITESFTVNSTYSANAVDFGGVGYYGDATYLGPAASKVGTMHVSFLCPTSVQTGGSVLKFSNASGTERLRIGFTTQNRIFIQGRNSANSSVFSAYGAINMLVADTWYTLTVSWDLANGLFYAYLGDTQITSWDSGPTIVDDNVEALGRCYAPHNGNSTLWMANAFAENAYYDLTVTATRRQFVDANGKPVDISALGTPHLRLTGDYTAFGVNTGSADNLALTGTAPTAAASSPTD